MALGVETSGTGEGERGIREEGDGEGRHQKKEVRTEGGRQREEQDGVGPSAGRRGDKDGVSSLLQWEICIGPSGS
ncbi:hypothetical protein ACLOJK_029325 [Asimina triloba]